MLRPTHRKEKQFVCLPNLLPVRRAHTQLNAYLDHAGECINLPLSVWSMQGASAESSTVLRTRRCVQSKLSIWKRIWMLANVSGPIGCMDDVPRSLGKTPYRPAGCRSAERTSQCLLTMGRTFRNFFFAWRILRAAINAYLEFQRKSIMKKSETKSPQCTSRRLCHFALCDQNERDFLAFFPFDRFCFFDLEPLSNSMWTRKLEKFSF